MKLSILIPSKRPSLLHNFITSLKKTADNFDNIELIILEDCAGDHLVSRNGNETLILHPKTSFMSELNYECYKESTGDWIMLGNDDLVMETEHWDSYLWKAFEFVPDQIAMFFPNDTIFKSEFPCFPIISRKLLEESKFFPTPNYLRYKFDDSLIQIIPDGRMFYLSNIILRHLNKVDDSEGEYKENKWGYKINNEIFRIDHPIFLNDLPRLMEAKRKLTSLIEVMA